MSVARNGFTESAGSVAQGFSIAGAATRYDSVLPHARLGVARGVTLANGGLLTPGVQVGYAYQVGTYAAPTQLASQDGTAFDSRLSRPGRGAPEVTASLAFQRGTTALFATIDVVAGSNWASERFSGGLQLVF